MQEMHRTKGLRFLTLSLEFYEKRRAMWLFPSEQVSYEITTDCL